MKIVATSDIHNDVSLIGKLHKYDYEADLLIIAGDLTDRGTKFEMRSMLKLIDEIKIPLKIVVLGNHDSASIWNDYNVTNDEMYAYCREQFPNIIFLNNETVVLPNDMTVYGTPHTSNYQDLWLSSYSESNVRDLTIPKEDVDIIISHEPPQSTELSITDNGVDIGNRELRKYLDEENWLCDLVICGHNHGQSLGWDLIGDADILNVAGVIMEIDYNG